LVTWNVGPLPSQASGLLQLTVHVTNNLDNGTRLTNTARIATTENVSAFVRLISTVASAPALSLAKSDGVASAAAGDPLTYALAYANAGNAPAQNVVITDHLPSNVAFQSCTPPSVCGHSAGVVTWNIGTVNAATGGAVTLTAQVSSTLPAGLRAITNTARIQTTTGGDDPADNFAQDVDAISTVPALALGVAFDASTPYPTKIITHTLRYTNPSAMHTTGVVISVTKSPYANIVSSDWAHVGGQTYTRAIGDLAAGASGQVIYVISLPFPYASGTDAFTNTFLIRDNGPGGLPPASAVKITTLGVPDLVIDSVSLSPITVTVGTRFTATLVIRNKGTGRACNPEAPGCGGTYVDAFVDPSTPPPSFPFSAYGDKDAIVPPLNPGMTATVIIADLSFT
ncbi:MAG: hypothetical protein ACRDH5_12030, partial [bacterium]